MTQQKGFLLAMMEPPPILEEEFNAWYDTEHLAERLAVPGFETARRYVCLAGWPRYLAFYDLASPEVTESAAYLRVAGENSSPWTRRILARVRGNYRAAGIQLHPGSATSARTGRALLLRFSALAAGDEPAVLAGLAASFARRPETAQYRLFAAGVGERRDLLAFVEVLAPYPAEVLDLAAFGPAAAALDLVNSYARY